jgi:hypothetical protein
VPVTPSRAFTLANTQTGDLIPFFPNLFAILIEALVRVLLPATLTPFPHHPSQPRDRNKTLAR